MVALKVWGTALGVAGREPASEMRSWSQIPDFEMVATKLRPLSGSGCRRLSLRQSWGPKGWRVSVGRKELLVAEEKLATYNVCAQRRHTDACV